MDWFPLYNSLRIALISTILVFFIGIFAANFIVKLPKFIKSIFDIILTLPLVLPPTVVGYFLLVIFSPRRGFGGWLNEHDIKIVMRWYSGILASAIVAFPLMYRTARGAFESIDENLKFAAQTLGMKNSAIFWRITMPVCKPGIIAGTVLSFARALGEYGATSMIAGYTPGKTATISTTVYQFWRTDNNALALKWVMVNIAISAVVLFLMNYFERRKV